MLSLAIKLISSSFVGQFFNLLVLIIIARLVAPESYGIYTIALVLVTYIVNFATVKYQHAIFVLDDGEAEILVNGARIFCALISFISSLIIILLNYVFSFWSGLHWIDVFLIGAAGYLSSTNLFYYYLSLKREDLKNIIKSRMLSPMIGGAFMLLIVYLMKSPTSLLVGYVFTLYIANLFISNEFSLVDYKSIKKILVKNIKFPAMLLPSGFIETINASYIIFATSSFFGVESAAFVGMYYRIIAGPQGMVCSAISDTVRNEFSKLKTRRVSLELFIKVILSLFLLSIVSSLVLFLFVKYLLVIVLGNEWSSSDLVFYSFMPLFFVTFLVSPITAVLYVRDGQKYDLVLQVFLIIMLILYQLTFNSGSLSEFIFGYSIIVSIKYCLEY